MSANKDQQPIKTNPRGDVSGVVTPEYKEPVLDAEAAEKRAVMLQHAQQMLELISQPTISERAQDILQNMPADVQQKLNEFGVVYNKDGTERTPEDVENQRAQIRQMLGEGPGIKLIPTQTTGQDEQTQENIDSQAAKVIQNTQYPDGLGPRSALSYDLPKIYAFEIENKVRVLIETLIEPLAFLNKESHEKMVDFKRYVDYLTQSHNEIKAKFEDTVKLKQLIKDFQMINKQLFNEQNREFDDIRGKISDNTQLLKIHEEKLIKVAEDKKIFEAARIQMRNDIREFELLSKDLVYQTNVNMIELKDDFRKQIDKCTDKIDSLRFEVQEMRVVHKQQKNAFRDIQGKMGWTEEVLKEMQSVTEDLPPLYNQIRATDKYLHKFLPLQIQNQIYYSQKGLVLDNPKIHLTLLENTQKAVDHLVALSEDEHMPFDKEQKDIPNLKFEIHNLTEKVKKMEDSDYDEDEEGSGSDSDSDDSDSDDSSDDGSDNSGVSDGEESGPESVNLGRSSSEQPKQTSKAMSSNSVVKLADTDPDEPAQDSEQVKQESSIQGQTIGATTSQPSSKKKADKPKKKAKKDKPAKEKAPSSTMPSGKPSNKKKKGQPEEMSGEAVDQLALRIASRLLKDEPFVNSLADILDGVPPPEPYYDSEEERAQKEKERKALKKQKKKEKKSGKKTEKSSEQASTIEQKEEPPKEISNKADQPEQIQSNESVDTQQSKQKKPFVKETPKVMSGVARRKAAAKAGMNQTIHEMNEEDDEQSPDKGSPKKSKPNFRNRSPPPQAASAHSSQRMNATPSPALHSGVHSAASSGLGRRRASNEEAVATLASLKQDGEFTKLKVTRLEAQVQSLLKKVSGLKSQVVSLTGESDDDGGVPDDDYGDENIDAAESTVDINNEGKPLASNGPASLETPASSSRGGQAPRFDGKGYVTTAKFVSAQKQIIDLRKKVGDIMTKLQEEDNNPRFAELIKTELRALSMNVEEIRHIQKCVSRAEEQVELLKLECKKELKRLQRQNFQVTQDFEQQQRRMENLHLNVTEVENRVQLSDTTMATIFKMLRIQYALLHQDEVDKQDIYLMGLKDASGQHGQQNVNPSSLIPPASAEQSLDVGMNSMDTTQSPHDASIISQNTPDAGSSRQKTGHREMKKWLKHGPPGSNGHQILSIDKNCLHQMGQQQIPALYKGFKMACLSYAPSQVTFENKVFDRNSLVEAQGYLLYLALQHMRHLDFSQIEKSLLGVTMQDEARAQGEELQAAELNQEQHIVTQNIITTPVPGGDGMGFDELKQDSLTILLSQGGNSESRDILPSYTIPPGDQSPPQQDRGTAFLSSRAGGTLLANPSSRMISLSKSKEYARLAANVPGVYSVEEGKQVLQNTEMQMSGVGLGQQSQDKYARNIHHLKLYQKQLQSQRGTSQGKQSALPIRKADEAVNQQAFANASNFDSLQSKHTRKKSILYAQSLRKNNQTTGPDDTSVQQFSLNSARQKRNIFAGDALKNQGSLGLNQRGLGYFENPLTPKSPQNIQLGISSQAGYMPSEMNVIKTPKRFAKISGIMSQGKTQVRTPRNEGGMSNMTSNQGHLSNALSSRPIQYNRFPGGLGTGQSLAIVPTIQKDRLADKLHSNPNVLSQHQLPSISMTRQSIQLPQEHLGPSVSSPVNAKPAPPKILINEKVPAIGSSAQITPDLKIDTQYEKEEGQGFDTINNKIRFPIDGSQKQFTDLVKTELNSRDQSL